MTLLDEIDAVLGDNYETELETIIDRLFPYDEAGSRLWAMWDGVVDGVRGEDVGGMFLQNVHNKECKKEKCTDINRKFNLPFTAHCMSLTTQIYFSGVNRTDLDEFRLSLVDDCKDFHDPYMMGLALGDLIEWQE